MSSLFDLLEPVGERMIVEMEDDDAPADLIVVPEISRQRSRIGRVVKWGADVPEWFWNRRVVMSAFAGAELGEAKSVRNDVERRMVTTFDVVCLVREKPEC